MGEQHRNLERRHAWRVQRKAEAREFIRKVRDATPCELCGCKPVDFHRKEHEQAPYFRVAFLAAQGRSIQRIQREIELSQALCRRCHMELDGRKAELVKSHRAWVTSKRSQKVA